MASKEARVKELETQMEAMTFGMNERAQQVITESNRLKHGQFPTKSLKNRFEDVKALLPEAYEI